MPPNFWQELAQYALSAAVVVGALAWLTRTLVVHSLSRDITAYKDRLETERQKEMEVLKSQTALQLEQARSDLARAAKEREVQFGHLHAKRAQAISELYALLNKLYGDTAVFTILVRRKFEGHEESAEALFNQWAEVHDKLQQYKLYLNQDLSDRIEGLIHQISEPSFAYVKLQLGRPELIEQMHAAIEVWSTKGHEIRKLVRLVETEFRKLLGSEPEPSAGVNSPSSQGSDPRLPKGA